MTPSETIQAFLDEVRERDKLTDKFWFVTYTPQGKKLDLSPRDADLACYFRTAAPKLAAALEESISWIETDPSGDDVRCIKERIAAILTDEGKGE